MAVTIYWKFKTFTITALNNQVDVAKGLWTRRLENISEKAWLSTTSQSDQPIAQQTSSRGGLFSQRRFIALCNENKINKIY
jgi:hypothetical protein